LKINPSITSCSNAFLEGCNLLIGNIGLYNQRQGGERISVEDFEYILHIMNRIKINNNNNNNNKW
jgi:hypothetical protein